MILKLHPAAPARQKLIVSDPISTVPILRHWYAVYPAGRQLSVLARAFLDYLLGRGDAAPASAGKPK
jgi:DNA-binding transcriptional LysR family regulator